jgi:hypothetical protein
LDQSSIRKDRKTGETTRDIQKFEISIDYILKFGLLGMIVGATYLHALLAPEIQ